MYIVIQLLTAALGALGYALLFGIQRRYLAATAIGGLITWGIYLALNSWIGMSFLACLIASSFAIVYSEMLARWYKTPAILFVVPSIVPLVPGGSLYYAMSEAVQGNLQQARDYGRDTLIFALAIACGICLVTAARDLKRQ